jgi:hypothetical protein
MATLVQSKSGTGTSLTTLTVTLSSATTAGNCLIVVVGTSAGTDNPQVSGITLGGSAGNFASAETAYNDADVNAAIWADQNCAGGQTSVVITLTHGSGSSPTVNAWVMEWSGVLTSGAVDKVNGANGSGTSWSTGSTGTLSQSVELIVGTVTSDGSSITAPGSPWTELTQVSGSAVKTAVGYQVVSATTAVTYNGTSGSGDYGCCIASFKLTGNLAVALSPATVTITTPAVTPSARVPLSPATAAVTVPAITPGTVTAVALSPAVVTITVPHITPPVFLGAAHATVTVPPVTPSVNIAVRLAPATVTVTVPAIGLPPRQLLLSIATMAGTDDYGNPFIRGIQLGPASNVSQLQLIPLIADGNASQVAFPMPGLGLSNTPNMSAGVISGSASVDLVISGPALSEADGADWVQLALFSGNAEGAEASMQFRYISTTGGVSIPAEYDGEEWQFSVPVAMNADVTLTDANLDMNGGSVTSINEVQTNSLVLNGQTISVPQGSPPSISGAGSAYNQTTAETWVTAINFILAVLQDAGICS